MFPGTKRNAAVGRPSSASGAKLAGSKPRQSLPTTYKDWQVKEEGLKKKGQRSSTFEESKKKTAKPVMSEFKGVGLNRPSTGKKQAADSDAFKKNVQVKFDNYLLTKRGYNYNEETDSLLEESWAEKTKDDKQRIMEEQKAKRRQERLVKKKAEEALKKKKQDQVVGLALRFKSQVKTFQRSHESQERIKASQDKSQKKQISELVKLHEPENKISDSLRPAQNTATAQLTDLRKWIEQQMKSESIENLSLGTSKEDNEAIQVSKPKKSTQKSASRSKSKSKSRTRDESSIPSNLSMDSLATKKSQKTRLLKHKLPGNNLLPEKEERKIGSRQNRYGVFDEETPNDFDRIVDIQRHLSAPKRKAQTVTYSTEQQTKVKSVLQNSLKQLERRIGGEQAQEKPKPKKPELQTLKSQSKEAADLKEDSTDKIPVKEEKRKIVNAKAPQRESSAQPERNLPGVVKLEKHYKTHEQMLLEKDTEAATVIQKFYRGFKGRRGAAKQRYRRRHDIEAEYGSFMKDIKQGRDYNLKSYLTEKKKLRQANQIVESIDDISEAIGESFADNHKKSAKSPHVSTQLQNFFSQKSSTQADHDPNSLIAIWARRNGAPPPENNSSVSFGKNRSKGASQKRRQPSGSKQAASRQKFDELISEEIYSSSFEDEQESLGLRSGSIEEDIPKLSGSSTKALDTTFGEKEKEKRKPSRSPQKQRQKAAKILESDSIVDEVGDLLQSSDIQLESHLKSDPRTEESIIEDSLIRDEYDNDNFTAKDASSSALARNKHRFGIKDMGADSHSKKITEGLVKVAQAKESAQGTHVTVGAALLGEVAAFEKASLGNMMVDRIEKVMVSSLAQKDQLIMAQRLAELEAEKRHKEEINRIREEQIKLMSQLMLLGIGAGQSQVAQPATASDKQREEAYAQIKQIIEKPIEIKREEIFVNYELPPRVAEGAGLSVSASADRTRLTYLQEHDQSRGVSIKESIGKPDDLIVSIIEEDLAQRSANSVSISKPATQYRHPLMEEDSIIEEDISDEVGDESIAEEIAESIEGSGTPTAKRQAPQAPLKTALTKPAAPKKPYVPAPGPDLFMKTEEEKEQESREAAQSIKQAKNKMKQIKNQAALGTGVADDIPEVSSDPDDVKEAIYQAHLMKEGLSGKSPNSRHLQKKKDAAEWLIAEKERAIKVGLEDKIATFGNNADELLKRALDLNVEKEIERRFALARQTMEESVSMSQANIEASSRSILSNARDKKRGKNKNVQFEFNSPSKKPVQKKADRSASKFSSSQKSSSMLEESIGESIMIGESISQSQNLPLAKPLIDPKHQAAKPVITQQQPERSPSATESVIDSEYSNDFDESMASKSAASQSLAQSKKLLQQKAKDIEESNAYSDDFDESVDQSAAALKAKDGAPPGQKMPVVSEEDDSIDESIRELSELSQSQQSPQSQLKSQEKAEEEESLTSADVEVKVSARSIEWLVTVPAADLEFDPIGGKASSDKYSEEFDDQYGEEEEPEDEDQFARMSGGQDISEATEEIILEEEEEEEESYSEFESNPDVIGNSASLSAHEGTMMLQAEKITEELMQIMINQYAADDHTVIDSPLDEDSFKKIWPWTLDKEPEPKPAPKPAGVKTGGKSPAKPPKSEREISDEAFKTKHAEQEGKQKAEEEKIVEFLDFMCGRVDLRDLIASFDKPIEQDPVKILAQIQAYEDEEPTMFEESSSLLAQQQILSQTFFNKIDREYIITKRMQRNKVDKVKAEDSDILTMSQEDQENIQNVHQYALFESLNEALDLERPYKSKGEPMPWSKNIRSVRQKTTTTQAKTILAAAKKRVLDWNKIGAGAKQAPLPTNVPQQDEFGEEIVPPPLADGEEERRNANRQDILSKLMTKDIQDNEDVWVEYEIEDTQSRFDLADMILAQLADELAGFLVEKGK